MKPNQCCGGWLRRRECLVPTWRFWLVLLLAVTLAAVVVVRNAYDFLALNAPVGSGVLVVEGWAPDYVLETAMAEFKEHSFKKLFVTGGPIERGAPLAQYRTHAEAGVATLVGLGMAAGDVQAVPAPAVARDRTYATAVALRDWLQQHDWRETGVNIITVGTHARRTRLMFAKAFGPGVNVGVVSVTDRTYDPRRWWDFSAGVESVVGEMTAYVYARLLFHGSPAGAPAN